MIKRIKRLTSAALCAALIFLMPSGVYAAGNLTELRTKSIDIADELSFVTTTNYNSNNDANAVENYFVYQPGGDILPMVCYGNDIAGAASANRVITLEKEAGNHLIGLTNADFFVMATGVSLGPVIKNGLFKTGGYSEEIIAFDKDGNAKIGNPQLNIQLHIDPVPVEVPIIRDPQDPLSQMPEGLGANPEEAPAADSEPEIVGYETVTYDPVDFGMQTYNKSISKSSGIVIFTKDFGSDNGSSIETYNIVVSLEEGQFVLGGTVSGTVESVGTVKGKTKLEKDKIYICMPADTKYVTTLNSLKNVAAGSSVSITFSGSEEFFDAEHAVGFEKWLVKDGEVVSGLDKSTRAPRTAAGIKADGSFILYTVDGRQKGYSMGFTYKELADRMQQLGCVQAVNLDGGGSTQLFAQLPGTESNKQQNIDSESGLRSCANYIVFNNKADATGKFANLHIYPYGEYILSGAKLQLSCLATDTNFYPVSVPEDISYSVDKKYGAVDENGLYTSKGSGQVTVTASSGKVKGTAIVNVIESPDKILANVNGKAAPKSLTAVIGKEYKLSATAEYKKMALASDPECFEWSLKGDIGYIAGGVYYPDGVTEAEGAIVVTAGETTLEIPVVLTRDLPIEPIQQMIRDMVSRERAAQMPVLPEE